MAIERKDEVLAKALPSDNEIIPRYRGKDENGHTIFEHVELQLENEIQQEGMPYNKTFANEVLAASGVASGGNGIYSLTQPGFLLLDGALVRFRVPENWGDEFTLNVNETGALPVLDTAGEPISTDLVQGAWVEALYSSAVGAYFFKSGGGALKIRIFDGLTAPTTGREGDIWVITDFPLTGRYSFAWARADSITNKQPGDVFLLANTALYSTSYLISDSANEKAKVRTAIAGLCYWDGSTFIKKVGFRVWRDGGWKVPFDYFYNAGTDYAGAIGGVGTVGVQINAGNVNVPQGYYATSQWARIGMSGGIEVGNLQYVVYYFSYGMVGAGGANCWVTMMTRPFGGGAHLGAYGQINGASSGNTTFSQISCDVRSAEGVGYPAIGISGGNTGGYTGFTLNRVVPTYL